MYNNILAAIKVAFEVFQKTSKKLIQKNSVPMKNSLFNGMRIIMMQGGISCYRDIYDERKNLKKS